MIRWRLLLLAAALLVSVSLVSVVAATGRRDPVALIPGALGLALGLPLWAGRRGVAPGLTRWVPAAIGAVLVLASLLAQGGAMAERPVLAASTLPLAAGLGALAGLFSRPRGARHRSPRRLLPAALGLPAVAALLAWYATFEIHTLLPVILPALTAVLGVALLASGWVWREPSRP
ncbi:MAG: hypothetical protein ABIO70_09005 [Pseudomonadota bacterium]